MKKILNSILTDKGEISSSRLINLGGFLVGSTVLLYHGLWLGSLDAEVLGLYLAYCASTYSAGKLIGRKYGGKDGNGDNETTERLEATGDSRDEYSGSYARDR